MMNAEGSADAVSRGTERRLLVAVDESVSSRRAVEYVADFFGDYRDVHVTLLSILCEPEEDFFPSAGERGRWFDEQKLVREQALADYRRLLAGGGIREDRIETRLTVRPCISIGDAILEEQDATRCCIVVLGRRGLTHTEEFVSGSTSGTVLRHARHCAVLVVE